MHNEPIKTIVERPGQAAEISVPAQKNNQGDPAADSDTQNNFTEPPYETMIPIGRVRNEIQE